MLKIPENVFNGRLCIVIDSPSSRSLGAERKSERVNSLPAVLNNFEEPLSPIAGNVTDMGTTTGKTVTLRYNFGGVGDGTSVELYDNSDGNPMATYKLLSLVELLTSEEYAPLVQSLQKHYSKGNFDSLSSDQMTEIIGSVPPEILPNIVSNVEYTAQVLGTDAGADGKEKDPQLSSIPRPLLDAIPEVVRTTCSIETLIDIERATCSVILLSPIIPTIVASRG